MKLTVICYEDGYEQNILIYVVEPEDPENEAEIERLVNAARADDIEEAQEMHLLFAFDGDLKTRHDWRD